MSLILLHTTSTGSSATAPAIWAMFCYLVLGFCLWRGSKGYDNELKWIKIAAWICGLSLPVFFILLEIVFKVGH